MGQYAHDDLFEPSWIWMQAAESIELRIIDKRVVKSLLEQHVVLAGKSSEHRSKGFLVFMPKVGVRSCSAKEGDNSPGLEVLHLQRAPRE